MHLNKTILPFCCFALLQVSWRVNAQDGTNANPNNASLMGMTSKQRYESLMFTTPAYRKEALRLLVQEANKVAQELNLPEPLPIAETNLVKSYISSPRMAQGTGAIGNITTSNFTYYVSSGNKFSYLTPRNAETGYSLLQKNYSWPMSRMDTNAAFKLATQLLAAASMDVSALNSNCNVQVDAFIPEGKNGKHFVPLYWVYWVAKDGSGSGPVALVQVFEPAKSIRQLRVNRSEYILRQPLQITNLDYLLSQTNAPSGTNAPVPP